MKPKDATKARTVEGKDSVMGKAEDYKNAAADTLEGQNLSHHRPESIMNKAQETKGLGRRR